MLERLLSKAPNVKLVFFNKTFRHKDMGPPMERRYTVLQRLFDGMLL